MSMNGTKRRRGTSLLTGLRGLSPQGGFGLVSVAIGLAICGAPRAGAQIHYEDFSSTTGLNIVVFVIASVLARGARFFIVAGLLYWIGQPIRDFIEKRLGLMFAAFMVLLIGGFVAVKYVF